MSKLAVRTIYPHANVFSDGFAKGYTKGYAKGFAKGFKGTTAVSNTFILMLLLLENPQRVFCTQFFQSDEVEKCPWLRMIFCTLGCSSQTESKASHDLQGYSVQKSCRSDKVRGFTLLSELFWNKDLITNFYKCI